jgi:3-hydroxymyristoyl/3-hydroxydecanoyl-(acyl carrier protein) dehydratase
LGELPHGYPFRFTDVVLREKDPEFTSGTVLARVSANARAAMGEAWGTPLLLAEALAQSALLLEGGDSEIGRSGFLAGIEDFSALRPPRAGESLRVEMRLAGRFGAVVRFEGEVFSESEKIARGAIIVRRGERPPRGPD